MLRQYKINSKNDQSQKTDMKILADKLLLSDFVSQPGRYSRKPSLWIFQGLKYAHSSFCNNWSHLTSDEAEQLIVFLTDKGLPCVIKKTNRGRDINIDIDEFIVFPGKNNKNEIAEALNNIFKPEDALAIQRQPQSPN